MTAGDRLKKWCEDNYTCFGGDILREAMVAALEEAFTVNPTDSEPFKQHSHIRALLAELKAGDK
jgi:hypothetical protein